MKKAFAFEGIKALGAALGEGVVCTQSFEIQMPWSGCAECVTVSSFARFSGEFAPQVSFSLGLSQHSKPVYQSYPYTIGKRGAFTLQQWRIPPLLRPDMRAKICVHIPEGTSLELRDFSGVYAAPARDWQGTGMRHNAHLGFFGMAPANTMAAFELAARCGFPACIVVPKVTADGVMVCIHDDTINATARDENGLPPSQPMNVADYSYDQLSMWEYGSWRHPLYQGEPLPLLKDFFALCAKTGMRPMFSTHPALSVEEWTKVRQMLIQFGLLRSFHIKSFQMDTLRTAYAVFGDSIDGYTFDLSAWEDGKVAEMLALGVNQEKCRVGMELKYDKYTKEIGQKITGAGMFAAVWCLSPTMTSQDYERLLSYGVTEYTEDYHCSMGLNW